MKKKIKNSLPVIACAAFSLTATAQTGAPQLRADNITEVINAMTIEEKAQLLVGGGNDGFVGSGAMLGHQTKLVAGAAGITVAIPRLGIPATVLSDGPAGVHINPTRPGTTQTFYATGFPIGSCLASTWNTQLVEQVGHAMGNEAREYGIDVILGPGMNLHRSPLCGRNFEYYGEDPILTGYMGAAMVKGIQAEGVGTSPKHFAVNSQENCRTRVDEQLSARALRELYLRGFEIMVRQAKPWTVMSAYNKINGTYCQGNADLLTKALRDEWGFDGIVMTDWIGKRSDLPTSQEVQAGNDLMMPGYPAQVQDIVQAVANGTLSMADVDRNVRHILEYIVKTPRFKGYQFSNQPDLKAHAATTRQCATEGMVLLKNDDGTLPMRGLKRVALFGVNSYDFMSGGLGSGCVNVPYVVDMVQGLRNAGISTTQTLTDIYQSYVKYAKLKLQADKNPRMWFLNQGQPKLDEIEISERCVAHEEPLADAAIITIGRQAGEGMDRDINTEFNLTQVEKDMISRVSDAFHAHGKKVIVIINSGSVMETASWRDRADAILMAWQPGEEGGNSVADVLTGKQNPSGKLTMTWPISVYDVPSTKNFPQDMDMYTLMNWGSSPKPGIDYTKHEEGIWVGYRYFNTQHKRVAYPFGYGLSYTTFQYSKPVAKLEGSDVVLSLTVKNTGKVAGKEAVQVYAEAPKGKLVKPGKELKAFAKTSELQPGQSETLRMRVPVRLLTSFDEAENRWVADAGTYTFGFAANVEDVRCTAELRLKGYEEKVSDAFTASALKE